MPARVGAVWRHLESERRLASAAALGLLLTLFLPWYQESVFEYVHGRVVPVTLSVTGWGAFSFVEAAVVLVSVSVLVLVFLRGEGRAFHLPGGDGLAITLAGGWTCFLIAWRMLDKSGTTTAGRALGVTGIEWGIFIALGVAGLLTYAGTRIRASHRPEPPLPSEDGAVFDGHWHTPETSRRPARDSATRSPARAGDPAVTRRRQPSGAPSEQPTTSSGRERAGRSSWRPADHPGWSDGEPQVEWLSAGRAAAAYSDPTPEGENRTTELEDRTTELGDPTAQLEARTEAMPMERRPRKDEDDDPLKDEDDDQLTLPREDDR
jgi:hypothetical protein